MNPFYINIKKGKCLGGFTDAMIFKYKIVFSLYFILHCKCKIASFYCLFYLDILLIILIVYLIYV